MKETEMSELLEQKININGELHLDKVQAALLINYMKSLEGFIKQSDKNMELLKKLVGGYEK